MTTPRPGARVRGSRTGRTVMALLDLLGRRWALRVLWELREGALSFRALCDACDGASPSVLMPRLDELRDAGIVEDGEAGYALTKEGHALLASLAPLGDWARRWDEREARKRKA
mgnify:CR=1 FL=1